MFSQVSVCPQGACLRSLGLGLWSLVLSWGWRVQPVRPVARVGTPSQTRQNRGTSPRTRWRVSPRWTGYEADGTPLAVTQKDFPVNFMFLQPPGGRRVKRMVVSDLENRTIEPSIGYSRGTKDVSSLVGTRPITKQRELSWEEEDMSLRKEQGKYWKLVVPLSLMENWNTKGSHWRI